MTDPERVELIEACRERESAGLKIAIVVPRKRPPGGLRARVAPGLMGEIATWHEDGRLVVYVDPAKLRRLLEG